MLNVFILTPEKEILSTEVEEIIVPTTAGEIGILEGHADLFSSIVSGILKLKNKEKTDFFAIHHGFIRVSKDKITILVKFCENSQQIDKSRLELATSKAKENLEQDSKWSHKLLRSTTRKELLELS